jgi:hypothetical protein
MFSDYSHHGLAVGLAALAILLASTPAAAADPAPFEVHDLSLWLIDAAGKTANAKAAFASALPASVNTLRTGSPSAADRRQAPICLITFHGQPASDLDVDLRTRSGSFLAHWPPGEGLPNRVRWAGTPPFDLVKQPDDPAELAFVDADHWIGQARQADGLYVKRGARTERFLAYDLELNLTSPVRLEGGPDKYRVINTTDRPVYDVLVSRDTPEGRRVAWIDKLPPTAAPATVAPAPAVPPVEAPQPAQPGDVDDLFTPAAEADPFAEPPAGEKPAEPAAPPAEAPASPAEAPADEDPFGDGPSAPAEAAPAEAAPPAEAPTTAPVKPMEVKLFGGLPRAKPLGGIEVALSPPVPADSPAEMTAALSERLTRAGLSADEVKLFVDRYAALFFSGKSLVVACRLDPAAIDERVPLSIFPVPKKTVRVAMVVAESVDPALGDEVERLIERLGDPKWPAREAAQQRLLEMGPAAFPGLKKATAHDDPEIAIRAERILLRQKQTPPGQTGAVNAVQMRGGVRVFRGAPRPVIINNN